jgi:hypothetical protein
MLNPYSPPSSSDNYNRDQPSSNACPVCHMHHRRVTLLARWRPCAGCGNRLFLQLPGRFNVMWCFCVAMLAIGLFSFASASQLRSAAVPTFLAVVGLSYFVLLYLAGLPIVLFGWGRASAAELERLRDAYRHRHQTIGTTQRSIDLQNAHRLKTNHRLAGLAVATIYSIFAR